MPEVVLHGFGTPGRGGPATALKRFVEASNGDYIVLWQKVPAGGISIGLLWSLVRELRCHRPRLIHVRGLGNEGFHGALAARLAGVPHVLVSIHGVQRDLIFDRRRLRRWIVVRLLEPATLKLASALTTVCHSAARRDFLDPYRDKLWPPVPNGVVLPALPDRRGAAVRQQLGISDEKIVAVTVSRLTPEKGYSDLAAALEILDGQGAQLDLVVVGGGDDDGGIRRQFAGLSCVTTHFVGQQADVAPYLLAADLFIFPSWHENLSNALLEAMAHGLPVVATDVGGNREVVEQGGGVLVPPHDPARLASAMADLLAASEARAAMGAAARQTVERSYSIAAMVQGWETLYRRLLDRP